MMQARRSVSASQAAANKQSVKRNGQRRRMGAVSAKGSLQAHRLWAGIRTPTNGKGSNKPPKCGGAWPALQGNFCSFLLMTAHHRCLPRRHLYHILPFMGDPTTISDSPYLSTPCKLAHRVAMVQAQTNMILHWTFA